MEHEESGRSRARRIHFDHAGSESWQETMLARGWLLADVLHAPDVVVCSSETFALSTARFPYASVVRALAQGEAAGEGADVVVFDPTPAELVESCDRALLLSRARGMPRDDLADIIECSADAFFVLDWDRLVTYQNRRALDLVARLEGGDGDILGEELEAHLPSDLLAGLSPIVQAVLREADPRRAEIHVGVLAAWWEASVYFIPAGAAVYLRDVTGRKREEALAASSLVQAVAADLGIPLTSERIRSAVDRLQRGSGGKT